MSGESTVRIGLLLPDVLGTYSDRGNAVVLAQRLLWRGIDAAVITVSAGSRSPGSCDLYVIGGGEDAAQSFAADWLLRHSDLRIALQTTRVLAVCAGLQVLGRWVEDGSGRRQPGLGILDLTTSPGRHRAVGEVLTRCDLPGVGLLTGFENHRGVTQLGPDAAPLAEVLHGVGNGSIGRSEGALTPNVVGTYMHGPVLARNPVLADHLLHGVIGSSLPSLELPDQEAVRRLRLALAAPHAIERLGPVRAVMNRLGHRGSGSPGTPRTQDPAVGRVPASAGSRGRSVRDRARSISVPSIGRRYE
jgi:CobQ-like glutamine amidotransferase family enzyme